MEPTPVGPMMILFTVLLVGLSHGVLSEQRKDSEQQQSPLLGEKDFRWPNRRLNVLVDNRSLNETERQLLAALLDQLEHRTCLKINRLSPDTVNPFSTRHLPDDERNFIYIFKAQFGLGHNEHPPLGLSSFGCVNQGRQSMVLGDLAFRWPELVLKYHLLRSLGVANLTRPETEVRQRLNVLPMSQKISEDNDNDAGDSDDRTGAQSDTFDPAPAFFAYATFAGDTNARPSAKRRASLAAGPRQVVSVQYLSEDDLKLVKDLYNCSDYSNRLSPKPLNELIGQPDDRQQSASKLLDLYSSSSDSESKSSLNDPMINKRSGDSYAEPQKPTSLANNNDEFEAQIHKASNADEIGLKIDDSKLDEAAKSIMNQLISEEIQDATQPDDLGTAEKLQTQPMESNTTPLPNLSNFTNLPKIECKPLESCPLKKQRNDQGEQDGERTAPISLTNYSSVPDDSGSSGGQNKPMLLKLDEFHAQDPQLQQADQMKLSQLGNSSIETYRLMNTNGDLTPQQQQQQFQLPYTVPPTGKSEVLISFEQSNPGQQTSDPVGALASSQVLKLCSCTCQTMAPVNPNTQPQPLPSPTATTTSSVVIPTTTSHEWTQPTTRPTTTITTTKGEPTSANTTEPSSRLTELPPETIVTTTTPMPTKRPPITESSTASTFLTTGLPATTSQTKLTTTTTTTISSQETTTIMDDGITDPLRTVPTVSTTSQSGGSITDNPCEQVQWAKPNKTVYASAKIVWDVDRANQNYFLCNNQINDELIPGKTHGFSCKVGNEGRSYELHNFNVLTKPESVNLAWIQRNSGTFGKTNLPVIGGYSKNQDPLVVSRCLVRDENNDVVTLIGYINSLGVGLFPFDDIQIECSQYDVLACVS